jgi:hypothetical protein
MGKLEQLRENDDLSKGGVKFDKGKTRWSLIKPSWLRELAEKITAKPTLRLHLLPTSLVIAVTDILTIGAKKYAERNWEKGMPWSRAYDAMCRHLNAWADQEDLDPDTGRNHLWHAACNMAFLIEWEQTHPEHDDRPFGPLAEVKQADPSIVEFGAVFSGANNPFGYFEFPVKLEANGEVKGASFTICPSNTEKLANGESFSINTERFKGFRPW